MTTMYLRPALTDHGLVVARTLLTTPGSIEPSPQQSSLGGESATATGTKVRQNETASDTSGDSN